MLDCVRTEADAERLLSSIQAKVERLFPQAQLFGISARDEFCRVQSFPRPNKDREEALTAAFANFRTCLEESILLNRDFIHLGRLSSQIERDLHKWKSQILLLRNGMQSSQIELSQAIAQCQQKSSQLFAQIQADKQQMRAEIEALSRLAIQWLDEFLDRVQTEAVDSLDKYELADVRPRCRFEYKFFS